MIVTSFHPGEDLAMRILRERAEATPSPEILMCPIDPQDALDTFVRWARDVVDCPLPKMQTWVETREADDLYWVKLSVWRRPNKHTPNGSCWSRGIPFKLESYAVCVRDSLVKMGATKEAGDSR